MISDKFNCVFVHIPKTAGQSIENFFLAQYGLTWEERATLLIRRNPDPSLGPEQLTHLKASEYVDFGYLTNEAFNSHFKFSFIRNPWARLVSEYKFRARYHNYFSFKEFVIKGLPKIDGYSNAYRHITPQYEFLYNAKGELNVDFVGRFENLQSDFDYVCSKLGIEDSLLPRFNDSQTKHRRVTKKLKRIFANRTPLNKHYTWYYDTKTKDLVGKMYDIDISTFGYKFDE